MSDEQNAIVPAGEMTIAEVMSVGQAMAQSGYFSDAREATQAVVKILAGREMGFGPFAAMSGIHIIKGKPAIGANLMAAAVKGHPKYDYRVTQMDDAACEVAYFQGSQEIGRSRFTEEDAERAGTQNMTKFPRNMLFARAMSNGVKWYCPDVFLGSPVYTPEELGAQVDGEGDLINITPTVTQQDSADDFDPDNPAFDSWGHLKAMAAKYLEHYKHPEHVTNTLKKIFNGDADNLTFDAAWQGLTDHAASKDAEQRQADAQAALEVDAQEVGE